MFHLSLVGLLIGVALGGMYGFKGTVLVKEGDGFANTVLSYDDVNPGRRFRPERLVPFDFSLRSFDATYTEDGKALTFNAAVDWAGAPGDAAAAVRHAGQPPARRRRREGLPDRPRLRAARRGHATGPATSSRRPCPACRRTRCSSAAA